MVKISKTVPQKEKTSSSQSDADKTLVDPRLEECVLAACVLTSDFKLDKGSPVPGRCVGKDAVLRSSSVEEEASASVPKPVKDNKRKRAPVLDDQKLKKRTAPRTKKTIDIPQAAGSMVVHKTPPQTEDISERDSGRVPELLEIEDASYLSRRMGDKPEGNLPESFRTEENSPGNSFGAVATEDSPTFPTFSAGAIREAQALGALELDRTHDGEDPFHDMFIGVEDTTGTSDTSDLFHGVQQALNQAATVHRESCSRSRTELRRYEAELQQVTEERNSLKLLLGQRGEEIKNLQDELARAHQDQIDLSEQWKEGMDRFAVEIETARTQLSSSENQLQKMKEKSSVQARRIEELEARLTSELVKSESDTEKAKADADALVAVYRADAKAAQVQAREAAETTDTRAHWVAKLARC
ncbi:eukaryotic translation initiation factor 3 subunit A-like [Nicotiana tomentosiformis]|uniref:eukaryotic translation initiation factor 3 subunit A-like n=1 Tax=Nicotiana tomentosiformis TaxID=4098 RepID=UPI00388CCCDE